MTELNVDGGVEVFLKWMDGYFKRDEQTEAYEAYITFDTYRRAPNQKITDFIMEFDRLYAAAEKHEMTLSKIIKSLKLLDSAKLSAHDRKFVLTGIDFSKAKTAGVDIYNDTKESIKKFAGGQLLMSGGGGADNGDMLMSTERIKTEPVFSAEDLSNPTPQLEEVLAASGFQRKGDWNAGGANIRGGRGDWRGGRGARGGFRGRNDGSKNFNNSGGGGYRGGDPGYTARGGYRGVGGGQSSQVSGSRGGKVTKPINPTDESGEPFTCSSCGSYRHLLNECPHSYENIKKNNTTPTLVAEAVMAASGADTDYHCEGAEGDTEDRSSEDLCDVILYTGYGKKHETEVSQLAREAINKAVLDSACGETCCGESWVETFLDSLADEVRETVVYGKSDKLFKFGGGEILPSLYTVELPCVLAGKSVRILADVVASDIPLLISMKSMKKAEGILDLANDRVCLFGVWVPCDVTSSGHYTVSLGVDEVKLSDTLITIDVKEGKAESQRKLIKIHRQFCHLSKENMVTFLKDSGKWDESFNEILEEIYSKCKTCRLFKRAPSRPVVALPASSDFNEVLTMDLKERKIDRYNYILHMIDAYTRFSVSMWLTRKLTSCVAEGVLTHWVAIFGLPKRIWTDLGGEFCSDEIKEIGELLNVELGTAGGLAPWMNGLCERNHQVIDTCLEKMMCDMPNLSPEIALAWACNAKNTLSMNNGFSSHQLVFGRNPSLPDVTNDKLPALTKVPTHQSLAEHLQAIHSARKACVTNQNCEKIRRALRHKVRSVERIYSIGDKVY